jgi:hypothetical protein
MFSPFAQDRGRGGCFVFRAEIEWTHFGANRFVGKLLQNRKNYRVLRVPLRAKRSSSVRVNMLRFPTRTDLSDFLEIKSSNLRKEIPSASAASARAKRSFSIEPSKIEVDYIAACRPAGTSTNSRGVDFIIPQPPALASASAHLRVLFGNIDHPRRMGRREQMTQHYSLPHPA